MLAHEWVNESAGEGPVLVFLHEGLGSIRQWRDFPQKVAQAAGLRGLVYDRYGYGQSDVLREPRRQVSFMHDEALIALPQFFSFLKINNPILVGHSDGASISLIHAAAFPVRAVVAMAPHVFVEPSGLESIRKAVTAFETTDLPQKLSRYHRDARKTFYGWADVWLDPEFEKWDIRADFLPKITCPLLGIQGHEDEYGSMAQLDEIQRRVPGECRLVKLAACGHSPFRDQPEKTLQAIREFLA
jgi:pimeloyl-ACP methyl ester carboxylesterase